MTQAVRTVQIAEPDTSEELIKILDDTDPNGKPIARPLLHHVQLKTNQLDAMVEWYKVVTGCQISYGDERAVWVTNDLASHRLAFVAGDFMDADPDAVRRPGLHHVGFEYATLDELLETWERLAALDILPHRTVNHGPSTSFYYVDPDGNSVELQVDNHHDWRESRKVFYTDRFQIDPFGPGVDPAKLLEARRAGVSADEVHRRSYEGEWPNTLPNEVRR
ncbi:MAG TPA: VOC family protein [Baekduia sp.]|nr:VOC family protein [Baekduia sp.]